MAAAENTETTLDLDQIMREGMARFNGEPETDVQNSRDITPPDDDADSPSSAGDEPLPDDGEPNTENADGAAADTPETDNTQPETDQPNEDAAEAEAGSPDVSSPADEIETPAPETDFRFKSHEEAEKGYRHVLSAKTRAEQRAKELQAQLEAVKQAEAEKAAMGKAEDAFVEFAAERRQQTLDAIDALDDDDPDYRKKVSRLWAETDKDLNRFNWQEFRQPEPRPNAEPEPQAPEVDVAGQRETVETMAREAGLTHDADLDLFRVVAGRTPEVDAQGRPLTLEQQVTWAIDETRGLLDAQRARFLEQQKQQAAQKNARALAAETPMGRTGAAPKPKAYDDAPFSLDDALNAAYEARRL